MKFFETLGKILLGVLLSLFGIIVAVLILPLVIICTLIEIPVSLVQSTLFDL